MVDGAGREEWDSVGHRSHGPLGRVEPLLTGLLAQWQGVESGDCRFEPRVDHSLLTFCAVWTSEHGPVNEQHAPTYVHDSYHDLPYFEPLLKPQEGCTPKDRTLVCQCSFNFQYLQNHQRYDQLHVVLE